jgi:hypothetical protein
LTFAEETLLRLAGTKAPLVMLGTDTATRKQAAEAWGSWWDEFKGQVDLAKIDLDKAQVGFTVLVRQTTYRVNPMGAPIQPSFQVLEVDRHKKQRWLIEIPGMAVDAQVVGPNRVLITEFQAMRVTERDFQGNIKWEKQMPFNPHHARRLPNGNLFVVMRNGVIELDRAGKEVLHHQRQTFDCWRAAKLPNGEIAVVTFQGQVQRIDPKTNLVVKSFALGANVAIQFGNMEVLPNGNLLIALYQNNKVVEYDLDGNKKWEANVNMPITVQRLPNGHTVVASHHNTNEPLRRVVELDGNGQQVDAIHVTNTQMVYSAWRR